jgi:hypothetical protein
MTGEVASDHVVGRLLAVVRPAQQVLGWATVELDRAREELGLAADAPETLPRDPHLGAHVRRVTPPGGPPALLLEPDTEGRLAATLARHGEGQHVTYLVVGRDAPTRAVVAGFALSTPEPGPLGRQRLVLGGERFGPHVVLVDRDGGAWEDAPSAGTIDR